MAYGTISPYGSTGGGESLARNRAATMQVTRCQPHAQEDIQTAAGDEARLQPQGPRGDWRGTPAPRCVHPAAAAKVWKHLMSSGETSEEMLHRDKMRPATVPKCTGLVWETQGVAGSKSSKHTGCHQHETQVCAPSSCTATDACPCSGGRGGGWHSGRCHQAPLLPEEWSRTKALLLTA